LSELIQFLRFGKKFVRIGSMLRKIELEDKTVLLLGTAHVSKKSVEEVREAILVHEPDKVCVELDEKRYRSVKGEGDWTDEDIAKTISDGNGYLLLLKILLSIYQRKIGEEFDINPGSEMVEAIEIAEEHSIDFELIDRDINETFKRAMNGIGFFEKMMVLYTVIEGFFVEKKDIDIEELKEEDMLKKVVEEFSGKFPSIKEAFIDERDVFMAEKISKTEAETVLAVVGAGHVEGISDNLKDGSEMELVKLSERRFKPYKILKYGVPALIIFLFAYGFVQMGFDTGQRMFYVWFLLNGSLAGLGALVSGAHLFTVLISFLLAPFTSINPALPAGLVAVYSENHFNHPKVKDMEGLANIKKIRGLWQNKATKLLLVFFFVNLGSSVATFIGAGSLANIIGFI